MNVPFEYLLPLAERISWAVLHSLWQGTLMALMLGPILRFLRGYSAAARHAACLVTLVLTLMAGLLTAIVVSPSVALPKEPNLPGATSFKEPIEARAESTSPAEPIVTGNLQPAELPASLPAVVAQPLRDRIAPMLPWVAVLWIGGVLMLSLRHCGGWLRVRALRRSGAVAGIEIRRLFDQILGHFEMQGVARLIESADALTPMLIGVFKPVIVIPARIVTGLGPVEIEAILAHEVAHLARRDTWSNLLQVIIETVLFYHPAVWWIGRRARLEREHAADDLALEVCADRRVYAGALVKLAEFDAIPAVALAATGGHLLMRIRRILAPPTPESAPSGLSFGLPATIAALALATFLGSRAIAEDPAILVAPGESIQAAIDKAPAGAVVRLAEGEWKERVVITNPLTLEGAGFEKTRVIVEEPSPDELKGVAAEVDKAGKAATTRDEKYAVALDSVHRVVRPAVWVHDADHVKIRKLRVQGISRRGRENSGTSALIFFQRAKAEMSECALVGPFGNGVHIAEQSEVDVARSFIGALWGEGIIVRGRGRTAEDEPSRLYLSDSEVRNVYHYGVVIGVGCDSTVIERCRISGTAWHGIRYDSASPSIIGNFIFGNARFGIYASGKTNAKVKGNVVWQNDMEGIWCLSGNSDSIEGNTFVGNRRGGIAVSDAKPTLAHNIIAGSPVGIACSAVRQGSGQSAVGEPTLVANLLFNNPVALRVGADDKPVPEGNLTADPKFRLPDKQDFTLATDSPARSAGIGVAEPLSSGSAWPLFAEEKSIIPDDQSRDSAKWKATAAPVPPGKKPTATAAAATPAASTQANPNAELVEKNRQAARVRAGKDRDTYTIEQLREIETLYQVANTKGKRSAEARESLTQLLEKYDKANRTGCATLYLGQASEGEERLKYLTTAVEKFSDCYYFNGCQVGGYGRYVLLLTLWDRGEKDKARVLLNDLKTTYKDATNHSGIRMGDVAEAVEKQLEAQR